jgi:hypothetical protein
MYKIIVALALLLLAGCMKDISYRHFKQGEIICKNNGGLNFINIDTTRSWPSCIDSVICKDGAQFSRDLLDTIKLEEKP